MSNRQRLHNEREQEFRVVVSDMDVWGGGSRICARASYASSTDKLADNGPLEPKPEILLKDKQARARFGWTKSNVD